MKYPQILERILVTFIEGFLAAWAMTAFALNKAIVVGAVAAGLSLVYNAVVKPIIASGNVPE